MLSVELLLTRAFSVLFFYHFSFFSISLAMSGLAFGGLVASHWNIRDMPIASLNERLATLALLFGAGTLLATLYLKFSPSLVPLWSPALGAGSIKPSFRTVVPVALVFLPGLIAAGAFLAAAFARKDEWIGRLYSADLLAAAAACILTIPLLSLLNGVVAILVPVTLTGSAALVLAERTSLRVSAGVLTSVSLLGIVFLTSRDPLPLPGVAIERWNDHSRVVVIEQDRGKHAVVIDRSARTHIPPTRTREPGEPVPVERDWDKSVSHIAYRLGRALENTAIIGVGGGGDLLAPLANGAQHVDGYEINGLIIELLEETYADFTGIASWPEVSLIHNEARVGIAHADTKYDVIQASLIDTWASTAAGGFVLSENGLYTLEGWRTFLAALTQDGLLTFTRWHIPDTPAETHRLVALAVASLAEAGITRPRDHMLLVAAKRPSRVTRATIVVSKTPYRQEELARLQEIVAAESMELLAGPEMKPDDPVIDALLTPGRFAQTVAASPYDISAPTDLRPYFFLQVRPRDVPGLFGDRLGFVLNLTFSGVRVMIVLGAVSLALALAMFLLAALTLPSASESGAHTRTYRWLTLYFLGIGFGFILVQLGLHQRLILILGHPTLALSVVLFSMLLASGLGAFLSRYVRLRDSHRAWGAILVVLAAAIASYPLFPWMERIASPLVRSLTAAASVGLICFFLGFAFPLGVRLAAPTGEWAVQKLWAVNGAASIAGTSLAALIGLTLGSQAVLVAGFLCYVLVALCGFRARRWSTQAVRTE
jgi:hypothetical protein